MRLWIFHPLVFYPLAALLALLVVGVSVQPLAWPRPAGIVSGQIEDGAIILRADALGAPAADPRQHHIVMRDFLGRAQTLRIAQIPDQPPPSPSDEGVRILLSPEQAALIGGRPTLVEVSYQPLPVNAASGLAVSLRGATPSPWVQRTSPPQAAMLRFELPASSNVAAIGLRAISPGNDQAYGLEITRIRIVPQES